MGHPVLKIMLIIELHPWRDEVVVGLAVELGEAAAEAAPPSAAGAYAADASAAAPAAHGDEEDDGRREGDDDRDAEGELGPRAAQRRHGD